MFDCKMVHAVPLRWHRRQLVSNMEFSGVSGMVQVQRSAKRRVYGVILLLALVIAAAATNLQGTNAVGNSVLDIKRATGRLVVGFKPGAAMMISIQAARSVLSIPALNASVFEVPEDLIQSVAQTLSKNPNVRYVEYDAILAAQFVPNDPLYSSQWGHKKINMESAWDTQQGVASVLVAVVDTGIDYNHPDIAPNYQAGGWNWIMGTNDPMDDNGHGTFVSGIIAARINNGLGIAGIANVRVLAEKSLDMTGSGTLSLAAEALVHAADLGAKIINNSYGTYANSILLHDAIAYAYSRGALLIAAAGNDNTDVPMFPASYPEVVSVAATDQNDHKAPFSNYGPYIELSAPGVQILSTQLGGSYQYLGGTSASSAYVSGVAALTLSQFSSLTRDQLRSRLRESTVNIGPSIYFGNGRIDASKAVGPFAVGGEFKRTSVTAFERVSIAMIGVTWVIVIIALISSNSSSRKVRIKRK